MNRPPRWAQKVKIYTAGECLAKPQIFTIRYIAVCYTDVARPLSPDFLSKGTPKQVASAWMDLHLAGFI